MKKTKLIKTRSSDPSQGHYRHNIREHNDASFPEQTLEQRKGGASGEWVPIKGTIELETTFGDKSGVKTIPVLYTVVDAEASYNIIMGRPTLNRMGAVGVATVRADTGMARRCYEDTLRVRSTTTESTVNVLDLDIDPRHFHKEERPHPAEDLKEVYIGPLSTHVTKIGTTLSPSEEA
ncbi:hypothetical protein CR513_29450, partial [Mucuna pruriens]